MEQYSPMLTGRINSRLHKHDWYRLDSNNCYSFACSVEVNFLLYILYLEFKVVICSYGLKHVDSSVFFSNQHESKEFLLGYLSSKKILFFDFPCLKLDIKQNLTINFSLYRLSWGQLYVSKCKLYFDEHERN